MCPRNPADDRQLVDMGAYVMGNGAKPHFTHVDPRLCDDADAVVQQALRLIKLFVDKHDVDPNRVVVSVRESGHRARVEAMTIPADSG